jgi:hypothetical protein
MDVDLQLFKNIMKESRNNSDLLDSYSPNQFKSKEILINHIKNLNILNSNSEITILGGWYGSILIPSFKSIKRITLIDIDKNIISIAKNRLFNHYKNVDFITSDVFHKNRYGRIMNANLIINTSCEHMKPMKELEPLKNSKSYFAFQSNNMFDIPTHINCVNTINEFKEQLPSNAKIMIEDYITDDRGTRFLLIGQL